MNEIVDGDLNKILDHIRGKKEWVTTVYGVTQILACDSGYAERVLRKLIDDGVITFVSLSRIYKVNIEV